MDQEFHSPGFTEGECDFSKMAVMGNGKCLLEIGGNQEGGGGGGSNGGMESF